MSDITYFDYIMFKLDLEKKYLPFLSISNLRLIIWISEPNSNFETVAKKYMLHRAQLGLSERIVKGSFIRAKIRSIRQKLYEARYYAELFKVNQDLPIPTLETLKAILKEKENKND